MQIYSALKLLFLGLSLMVVSQSKDSGRCFDGSKEMNFKSRKDNEHNYVKLSSVLSFKFKSLHEHGLPHPGLTTSCINQLMV